MMEYIECAIALIGCMAGFAAIWVTAGAINRIWR